MPLCFNEKRCFRSCVLCSYLGDKCDAPMTISASCTCRPDPPICANTSCMQSIVSCSAAMAFRARRCATSSEGSPTAGKQFGEQNWGKGGRGLLFSPLDVCTRKVATWVTQRVRVVKNIEYSIPDSKTTCACTRESTQCGCIGWGVAPSDMCKVWEISGES